MHAETWIDSIPLGVLFAGTVLLVLLANEGGYRLAAFRERAADKGRKLFTSA